MASESSLWSWTKRTFIKGLATLLPAILTVYVFLFVFSFVRNNVSEPINTFIGKQLYATDWGRMYLHDRFDVPLAGEDGQPLKTESLSRELKVRLPWWPGFIIAFLLVLAVGFFIASWIGRRFWYAGERMLTRVPIIKVIYPYAKQVTDFIFGGEKKPAYSSVVAVQYPRPGIWSIGFVTGPGLRQICERDGERMINIFIPFSPLPMSGATIVIREQEAMPLNLTVDEAMRFIISAGVIVPGSQLTPESQTWLLKMQASRALEGRSGPADRADK